MQGISKNCHSFVQVSLIIVPIAFLMATCLIYHFFSTVVQTQDIKEKISEISQEKFRND